MIDRPKAKNLDRQLRWLYVIPVSVTAALWLDQFVPATGLGGSPEGGLWGAVGALWILAFRTLYRSVAQLIADVGPEGKVISEKIKLLANAINVIAVVCVGAALAEPLQTGNFVSVKMVVLFLLATYAHLGAQRFLSLLPLE